MANNEKSFYELYRTSSIGVALTDTLDELISNNQIEPQLAMKIIGHFDKAFTETISDKVKSKLSFKGHLDTYRFCDDVWTFLIKDVNFKLDNQSTLRADKVKIVSCTNKKADLPSPKEEPERKPQHSRSNRQGPAIDLTALPDVVYLPASPDVVDLTASPDVVDLTASPVVVNLISSPHELGNDDCNQNQENAYEFVMRTGCIRIKKDDHESREAREADYERFMKRFL